MKWLILISLLVATQAKPAPPGDQGSTHQFKMCVPAHLLSACEKMVTTETADIKATIVCHPARDRLECLQDIQQRQSDFGVAEPEDMYIAAQIPDEDFKVFEEIRTKDEPEAEFRYEAVAVVHKDLEISKISQLKGLKSCHTGVGRNVGYKVPITKLKNMGLIGNLNDQNLSPRENELKAFSTFFSKSCLVGKWSPDPEINKRLKNTYSNLCQLCEHPDICDYPDNFSGYDGALRCLAHNGGQVAFTKVIYVKKFFGLPVGTLAAVPTKENHEKFAYLCPDGTKRPINGPACIWAARPWPGFIGNPEVINAVSLLRQKLSKLTQIGETTNATWFDTVLTLNNKSVIAENDIFTPEEYLAKANYTDVIERDYGPPKKTIRLCVVSDLELEKCREFSKAAFSRDIRPSFDCVQQDNKDDCFKIIRDNGADIIAIDFTQFNAKKDYNLRSVASERYADTESGLNYIVAVVKKGSKYNSFADLRGAKACYPAFGRSGYIAAISVLTKQGLIAKNSCPYPKTLAEFFSGGSCLPGALLDENNADGQNPESLCSQCVGDIDSSKKKNKCAFDNTEAFFGHNGAFRCLASGHGDVAFMKDTIAKENTDGKNKEKWASSLKSSDFELLCPDGKRVPIDQYQTCNVLTMPPREIITSNSKNDQEIDEIRHAILTAGQLYGKRPDLFKLFGTFKKQKNLLFLDSTVNLVSVNEDSVIGKDFIETVKLINSCSHS